MHFMHVSFASSDSAKRGGVDVSYIAILLSEVRMKEARAVALIDFQLLLVHTLSERDVLHFNPAKQPDIIIVFFHMAQWLESIASQVRKIILSKILNCYFLSYWSI